MKILFLNGGAKNSGATATLLSLVQETAQNQGHQCRTIHLGEQKIHFCTGCKSCYTTGICFQQDDDVPKIWDSFQWADGIVIAIPSYWGDMPGQMKAFVDRCTSVCNTNAARKGFCQGKVGYGLALRAGTHEEECQHLLQRIEHFLGHLDIPMIHSAYFCGIETEADILTQKDKILEGCGQWF